MGAGLGSQAAKPREELDQHGKGWLGLPTENICSASSWEGEGGILKALHKFRGKLRIALDRETHK